MSLQNFEIPATGIGAFLLGLIPWVVNLLKQRREQNRLDMELEKGLISKETHQLISDLKAEREEVKKELERLRDEHEACIRMTAKQEAAIERLKIELECLKRYVSKLANGNNSPGELHLPEDKAAS